MTTVTAPERRFFKVDLCQDYIHGTPPPFGHAMQQFFSFDSGYINLNNCKSNMMESSEYICLTA